MQRRSFYSYAIFAINAIIGALIALPATVYALFDPRNRPKPPSDFRRVAKLSELSDGVPFQAVVRNTRRDAWAVYPNAVVGRVWLIKQSDEKVKAFTTICPHLGCSINFIPDAGDFVCPCHGGTWSREGETKAGPVPRGMDLLECKVVAGADGESYVEVQYLNFKQGLHEPVPK